MTRKEATMRIEDNNQRIKDIEQMVQNAQSIIAHNRDQIAALEHYDINQTNDLIDILRRIKRLECTHPYAARRFKDGDEFSQVCEDCGKLLKVYKNRRDMLEAKMAIAEAEYKETQ